MSEPGLPAKGKLERRAGPRAAVKIPVCVLWRGSGPTEYVAENLSAGGALLTGGPALVPGADVRVALPVGSLMLHVQARVVHLRTNEHGAVGSAVRFIDLCPNVQDIIQSHVLAFLRQSAGRRNEGRED